LSDFHDSWLLHTTKNILYLLHTTKNILYLFHTNENVLNFFGRILMVRYLQWISDFFGEFDDALMSMIFFWFLDVPIAS
jgi:hypothetical protein